LYSSFDELNKKVREYAHKQRFRVTQHHKKVKELNNIPWLKEGDYQYIIYNCHRAKGCGPRGTGKNASTTIKKDAQGNNFDCKFTVQACAVSSGGYRVNKVNLEHTHPKMSASEFNHLPQNRKLKSDQEESALKMFQVGSSTRQVKEVLQMEYGNISATSRDLLNIKRDTRGASADAPNGKKRLEDMLTNIKGIVGLDIEIIENEEKEVEIIILRTPHMNECAALYGDILLLDSTYNLVDIAWPVYFINTISGNMSTEIVTIALVKNETSPILITLLEKVKEIMEKPKCIMTDKDESLRSALKTVYTDSDLLICLFHMQQAVNKHITNKCQLTPRQREFIVRNVQAIINCSEEDAFNNCVDDLQAYCEKNNLSFYTYFNDTWLTCKKEWAKCFTNKLPHLGTTTNNRTERLNREFKRGQQKLKIEEFIKLLSNIVNFRHSERVAKFSTQSIRQPMAPNEYSELSELSLNYSKQSIKMVKSEYKKYVTENCDILDSTTDESCSCPIFITKNIICKHIFKKRHLTRVPVGDIRGMGERWRIENVTSDMVIHQNQIQQFKIKTIKSPRKAKILSNSDKYKIMQPLSNRISNLPNEQFSSIVDDIEKLLKSYEGRKRETIVEQDSEIAERVIEENGDGDEYGEINDVQMLQNESESENSYHVDDWDVDVGYFENATGDGDTGWDGGNQAGGGGDEGGEGDEGDEDQEILKKHKQLIKILKVSRSPIAKSRGRPKGRTQTVLGKEIKNDNNAFKLKGHLNKKAYILKHFNDILNGGKLFIDMNNPDVEDLKEQVIAQNLEDKRPKLKKLLKQLSLMCKDCNDKVDKVDKDLQCLSCLKWTCVKCYGNEIVPKEYYCC
jgi:hypothetical protein